MRASVLVPFLIIHFSLFAQPGNFWHFGQGNCLDFSSGAPVQVAGSQIRTPEGCASMSDANGQLLFYTNGGGRDPLAGGQSSGKIWNGANQVVYDMGNTEGGGFSAVQSSVFVPKPGAPGRYYLFTMEETEFDVGGAVAGQPLGRGLSYFELDAAANGGSGAVVDYENAVYLPSYEALCAVRHTNGQDYWIIITDADNGALVVFALTASGLAQQGQYFAGHSGFIKGAPDGRHLATGSAGGLTVYNFDPATGIPSAPVQFAGQSGHAEFSPNGRYLYTVGGLSAATVQVFQYDLEDVDPANSQTFIGAYSGGGSPPPSYAVGQMQVAADGRIYFVIQRFEPIFPVNKTLLSVINCPNGAGAYMDFNVFEYLRDGSGTAPGEFFGLPNFDNAIFFRNDTLPLTFAEDTVFVCNSTVTLDPGLSAPGYTFLWSTGATTPTLTVGTPGAYTVTVTDECGASGSAGVAVLLGLNAEIEPMGLPCAGSDFTLAAAAEGGQGQYTYQWNDGSTGASLAVTASGTYTVTVSDPSGCTGVAFYAAQVSAPPLADISVAQAPDPCNGGFATLNAAGGTTYNWSTGVTTAQLTVTSNGSYTVTVTDAAGCSDATTVDLVLTTAAPLELVFSGINPDCFGNANGEATLHVEAGTPPYAILWNNGVTDLAEQTGLPAGTYTATVTDATGCSATGSLELSVAAPLDVMLDVSNPACANRPTGEIALQMISGGLDPYFLSVNGATQGEIVADWKLSNLPAGTYQLVFTDGLGCSLTRTVTLVAPPAIGLTLDPTELDLDLGETTQLDASVASLPPGAEISWTPGDGLSCLDCLDPILLGLHDAIYRLIVSDQVTGCLDSAELRLRVRRTIGFFVPNIFSPDDNGRHDVLPLFAGQAVRAVDRFEVYDRWGGLVYSTDSPALNDEARGWDGTWRGKAVPAGVYVWYARVQLVDGTVETHRGDVTILR